MQAIPSGDELNIGNDNGVELDRLYDKFGAVFGYDNAATVSYVLRTDYTPAGTALSHLEACLTWRRRRAAIGGSFHTARASPTALSTSKKLRRSFPTAGVGSGKPGGWHGGEWHNREASGVWRNVGRIKNAGDRESSTTKHAENGCSTYCCAPARTKAVKAAGVTFQSFRDAIKARRRAPGGRRGNRAAGDFWCEGLPARLCTYRSSAGSAFSRCPRARDLREANQSPA
jgi:hypothetical protein